MLNIYGFAKLCGISPYFTVDRHGLCTSNYESIATLFNYAKYVEVFHEAETMGFDIPMTVPVNNGNGYYDITIIVKPDHYKHKWSF